jgi:2-oxoglutarate ferredoxin oxidoreductase subunit delta
MAKGRIVVDETRCKGCALCTTACPQDVIVLAAERLNIRGYHPVELMDRDGKCTGCALCAMMCPDAAITVYRFKATPRPKVFADSQTTQHNAL